MTTNELIRIERIVDATQYGQLARLLPQLSRSSGPFKKSDLEHLLDTTSLTLLGAFNTDNEIVGMLSLVIFSIPTGTRALIEDVVVNETIRGKGIGSSLVAKAIEIAKGLGAKTVDLTSRPEREAANRLYLRLGFEKRETNVYRIST